MLKAIARSRYFTCDLNPTQFDKKKGNEICMKLNVQFFLEGHKNVRNSRQNHNDDCAHFCGLLRKAELYRVVHAI